jgi:ABC-2 type transport system permease protein
MFARLSKKYRYSLILLRQLVITDFKLRYQGSWLGYLWSLLKPLALFLILYFVFVRLIGLGGDIPHYPVYLLLGIVLWNYFNEVANGSVSSIVGRGDIIRKINFPKYVIVLAGSFSALINLLINFCVVAVFMVVSGADVRIDALIWVPLIILELFTLSLGVAFFLSAIFVRFRDVGYIWELIMQAAFYATPILYPLSMVSPDIAKILMLNPVAQMIQDTREVLVTAKTTTIGELYGNEWVRLIPIGTTILVALLAAWYFRKRSRYFAEEV